MIYSRNNDKQLNIDTWKALEDLYKQKKVRAIGLSNFLKHHLEKPIFGISIPFLNLKFITYSPFKLSL